MLKRGALPVFRGFSFFINFNVIRPISGIIYFFTKPEMELIDLSMFTRSYWLENINAIINFFEVQLIVHVFTFITKKAYGRFINYTIYCLTFTRLFVFGE